MLRISVLGEFRIEADGRTIAAPDSRRARLLLGWLALHPGRHARAELAAKLRPDVLDESARSSLRQAAWALRPALGDALAADRTTIGLADDVWVDAREFHQSADAGADPAAALALVRGPLLEGLDEDWVLDARYAQQQAEDALLERMAGAAAAAGDTAAALALAGRRVERDPLSEEAHRALMTRQAEAGDRAAALRTYDRLADRLRSELAVAPSAVTRALAAELREDAPPAPDELPPRLAASARTTAFVGREKEVARALASWREVRSGSLRTILLAGEPGIGKTRLAAELAARAHADGATVVHGRCTEEQLGPYQAWAEALEQLGAPFDPAGEGTRLTLFQSVVRSLTGARRPVVLVLDDLHWADRPSLLLLAHLAGAAPSAPLLVVGTYRDTEAGTALQDTLADLRREPGVERLKLRGLGDREVASLVEAIGAGHDSEFGRAVSEETGGSPFFVHELIRHLEETGAPLDTRSLAEAGLPESVGEVLGRRLDRLGESARGALDVAAVAGLEFRTDVVAAAAGMDARRLGEVLDAAVAAGLAAEPPAAPARYAFPHALVREALYGGLGAARRAALHADVARTLERLGGAAADPAALAHHYAAARLPEEALVHGEAAARAALGMLAWEDAAAHVERAFDASPAVAVEPEQRARLLLLLGEARGRAGAVEQAGAAFAEVAALALELGSGEMLARAALGAGGVGVTIVDVDAGLVDLLEEALAALGDERPDLRARLAARLATELYYAGEAGRERGRALTADAVALARGDASDPVTLTETLAARRVALWDPRHLEERLAVDGELIGLGARHREAELRGRHWRFVDLAEAGDLDAARAELDRYETLARELRMPAFTWYVPLWRASLAIFEGRFDDGARLVDEAHAAGRLAEDANAEIFHVVQRTAILIDQERFAEVEIPDTVYERLGGESAPVAWMTGMAWALAERGSADEALAVLADVCADDLAKLPWDANRLACLAELTEAACILGAVEHGATIERSLAPWAERNLGNARAVTFYGSGLHFLGKLAALRGDRDAARNLLEAAVARNAAYGAAAREELSRRELQRVSAGVVQ